jgi:Tfp pilus assembly protein PilN
VRPVNLIPSDQRRGASRATGKTGAPIRMYILFGTLGAVLLGVLALALTSNQINSKTEELAKVQSQEQGVKQVADALRPYGQFAQLQQAREQQIAGLVSTRFNWERALRQLSRAIPTNVWLLNLAATASPGVDVEGGAGGGDISNLREKAQAPAFTLTGCTYSQHAVARVMTRMRNLDDVTDVQLAKSARREETDTGGGTAVAQTSSDQQAANQQTQDCVGSTRITKFDLLVVFGAAPGATPDAAAGASVPPGSAAPIASAQGAAASSGGASTGAATTGASAGGGQ